jgi:hypothetical protein
LAWLTVPPWGAVNVSDLRTSIDRPRRIGWSEKDSVKKGGSHPVRERPGWLNFTFAFHDEIGPKMLARIGKVTGLRPEDL